MKKFLLVIMIGMVLALDVCGIVKEFIDNAETEQESVIERISTIVYVE